MCAPHREVGVQGTEMQRDYADKLCLQMQTKGARSADKVCLQMQIDKLLRTNFVRASPPKCRQALSKIQTRAQENLGG